MAPVSHILVGKHALPKDHNPVNGFSTGGGERPGWKTQHPSKIDYTSMNPDEFAFTGTAYFSNGVGDPVERTYSVSAYGLENALDYVSAEIADDLTKNFGEGFQLMKERKLAPHERYEYFEKYDADGEFSAWFEVEYSVNVL